MSVELKRIGFFLVLVFAVLSSQYAVAGDLPDFTELAADNGAAVVNISTKQKVKRSRHLPKDFEMPGIPEGSPFEDFFRRFFGEEGEGIEEFNRQSLGSGFIIDKDGYVVTNHHVIRNADEIIVRLNDRRELKAEVIGSDPRSDVALLKIDADNLPTVEVGRSDSLKVGEWVMAIGSPFGFDHSVSVGVVSAMGRNLPSENYVPFIQTDVAINPGNSGGPLFNLKGEVVGINSQIYSRTGGFMGLSFAIPVDVAMDVVKQLKTKGKVSRGWLGVLIQDVNRELAESFGMKQPRGAVVLRVLDDSPASKAGFKVGDVVIKFDGRDIHRSSDLPLAVGRTPINTKVKVKVIREGKQVTLWVKVGELPSEDELAEESSETKQVNTGRLGVVVENLSAQQRKRLEGDSRGVVITEVTKGAARDAGLHQGDIILMINNKEVKNTEQFRKLVKDLPDGKSVPVLIHRNDHPEFLALKVPD
ncbi:MAG: DegQ family serine endoprotease [Gammaproteobacteria bacterium]